MQVAGALMQQIILRTVKNMEFRSNILSKLFTVLLVISEVDSNAVVLKIYFKRVVNANSSLFSMIVASKSCGCPLSSQKTPKNCVGFLQKKSQSLHLSQYKYLPQHSWSFLLSVLSSTYVQGRVNVDYLLSSICSAPSLLRNWNKN